MIWLKALHLVAIAIWSAGLVCLPGLYARRRSGDRALQQQLPRLVRFLYVGILSPAAFVAIGSGTALIFLRQPYHPWFSIKLALVGLLVVAHIINGLVIVRLFEAGNLFPFWRFLALAALTLAVVLAILFVVLAKPEFSDMLPAAFGEPGGLRRIFDAFNPFPRS